MLHRKLFLTVFLVVLALGAIHWGPTLLAATPTPAEHQIVGSWHVNMDSEAPVRQPALLVFTSDGTMLQFGSAGATTVGSWSMLTNRAAQITSFALPDSAPDGCRGGSKLGGVAEAGDAGEQITMIYTVQCFDVTGTLVSEEGPITATGSRITVDPIPQPVATVLTP
jgi:hypothetical protein